MNAKQVPQFGFSVAAAILFQFYWLGAPPEGLEAVVAIGAWSSVFSPFVLLGGLWLKKLYPKETPEETPDA